MSQGGLAGFQHAQFLKRTPDGQPCGIVADPNSISNGTTMHAYKLVGPVEAGALSPSLLTAVFFGGQATLGQKDLGVESFGTFPLTLSHWDTDFINYIRGGGKDDTIPSSRRWTAPNTEATPIQGMLGLTMSFTLATGAKKWLTVWYPNVEIAPPYPAANQQGGVNPNPMTLTVTPSPATMLPNGLPVASSDMTLQNDRDVVFFERSDYPVTITAYKAATSATQFITGYRPLSTDVAQARNYFSKDGADFTPTSINASTGVVVIPSATNAEYYVAEYETAWRAI